MSYGPNPIEDIPNILLIGCETEVGHSILDFDFFNLFQVVAPSPDKLNVTDPANLMSTIKNGFRGRPWFAVMNCAEYVSSDGLEGDEVMAWLVNAVCPAAIGEACARSQTPLVQLFSNNVDVNVIDNKIDGSNALNFVQRYDESKGGGEGALRQSGARYTAIRADRIIGNQRNGFICKIIDALVCYNDISIPQGDFGGIITAEAVAQVMCLICIESNLTSGYPNKVINISELEKIGWDEFIGEVAASLKKHTNNTATLNIVRRLVENKRDISTIARDGLDAYEYLKIPKNPWRYSVNLLVENIITSQFLSKFHIMAAGSEK